MILKTLKTSKNDEISIFELPGINKNDIQYLLRPVDSSFTFIHLGLHLEMFYTRKHDDLVDPNDSYFLGGVAPKECGIGSNICSYYELNLCYEKGFGCIETSSRISSDNYPRDVIFKIKYEDKI